MAALRAGWPSSPLAARLERALAELRRRPARDAASVAVMRTDEGRGPRRLTATRWTEIDAARQGDAEAQRRFVEKYRPALVAYFARRGLVDDAEDVAQQVFLKLFGRVLSAADAGRGRFRSLLFTVASRTLASHLAARNAAARGGGQVEPLGDSAEQVPAAEDADAFDRERVRALLRACLARLRAEHEHYHRAVAGTLLEGRPQREVAQAMGCSPTDVKNYVRRGRSWSPTSAKRCGATAAPRPSSSTS